MIINLQRSIAEAGRIRIGQTVPSGNGRTRPAKLGTFRLTSGDRQRIEEAAALFGGEVRPWQAPAGAQWEVITEATAIDVIVPPSAMAFSQHYELWSAGGCQRRCDGETESLTEQACLCDPEQRECDIHTRLSLMIRDLPGLGLWRIDTSGWYAAREIAGAVEIMAMAAGRGILLPARLLLEQRSVKRPGKDGKPQTLRFAVPRLDPGITPGELLLAGHSNGTTLPELTEGSQRPKLLPVPRDETPVPSIAEQSAPPAAKSPRRNAAPEIPASGRSRAAGAKQEGEPGYWRARTFAAAGERGMDADALRPVAAQMLYSDDADFSLSVLDEGDWERLYGVVIAFKTPPPDPEEPDRDDELISDGPRLLTVEQFRDLRSEHDVSLEDTVAAGRELFPAGTKLSDLDDADRGRLWVAIQERRATVAST